MPTRSMLVSFVGYPNEVFNLVPDNGLANLAACLVRAGHSTLIWDCSTVSTIGRLYPHAEREQMNLLRGRIMARVRDHREPDDADVQSYHALERRADAYQESQIGELAREMAEHARRERLHFVAFKLWSGVGFRGAISIAQEIKKLNPGIKVFGGGPHVDWFMQRSFEITDAFDVFAYGEGEDVIVRLAEYAEGTRELSDVPNAIYLKNGRPVINEQARVDDLASLPLPCYDEDVYPAMKGDEKIKIILLDESRGCPNSCNFCIHPVKSGRRRRTMTAVDFVDRLERIIQRYRFRSFRFAGSNPPARLRREIAREIIDRNLEVSFCGFAHVRGSYQDDYRLLKRAGCRALAFGVESGSQRILDDGINKRVKVSEIRDALLRCKKAGLPVVVSVIVPSPFETEETKEETYRLLCETRPDAVYVSFPVLAPGTAWEKERARFGFEIRDLDALYRREMTFKLNTFAPAVLWRPLEDYRLGGKTFLELGRETAEFILRLKKAGLITQFFDQMFLISEFAGMPAAEFAELASEHMSEGRTDRIRELVSTINRNVLYEPACAAS